MSSMSNSQAVSGDSQKGFGNASDLLLAGLLAAIVALMILPLPLFLLDSLLAINISLGVILVLMAIYVNSPLQFSVFPSVLLISTLFRLALSIATTRMILLNGDAGNIVDTFGQLVAGGNVVVGMVVFLIITIVQFLVIAKGAERVAEVGARFTLDAMPGKQMSIDSDLRSGLIDKVEAKRKREEVALESQLHGSMDGAMKFVKGDAIAGIVIILVNLLGGLTIGISQLGMSAGDAMSRYSILTIGDGMVAQIPALFGAISAGLIVTRVSPEDSRDNLGVSMHKQFTAIPRVLIVAGVISFMFALVPGFPVFTFLMMGLVLCLSGALLIPALKRRIDKATQPGFEHIMRRKSEELSQIDESDESDAVVHTVALSLNLPASMGSAGQDLIIKEMAAEVFKEYQSHIGVQLPKLSFNWNADSEKRWTLYGYEVPIASGEVSDTQPVEVLRDQLSDALKKHGYLFVGIQEVLELMAATATSYPDIVKEAMHALQAPRLATILRNLVQEDISIRNLRCILEALINSADREKDTNNLTEIARISLAREISHRYAPDGELPALIFSPKLEEHLRSSLRNRPGIQQLSLDPAIADRVRSEFLRAVEQHSPAAVVASPVIRRACGEAFGDSELCVPVLSYAELIPTLSLKVLERIDLKQAPAVRSVTA